MSTVVRFPPTFFGIAFGLFGLARVWREAAPAFGLPIVFGDSLALLAGAIYLGLLAALIAKAMVAPAKIRSELTHPILGAFYALVPIDALLFALNLRSILGPSALPIVVVALAVGSIYASWITASWIARVDRKPDDLNYGYFLPTVAMGLIGGDSLAVLGYPAVGTMYFGVGTISWVILASIFAYRAIAGAPRIGAALLPTLAIELAPAAVVGNAYLSITGGHNGMIVLALAGYAAYTVLQQLFLIPMYRVAPFSPGFWAFTFPWAASATFAIRTSVIAHDAVASAVAIVLATGVTVLILGIGVRSLIAIGRGTFVPKPT